MIGSHTYAQTGSSSIAVTVTPLTIAVSRIDSSDPNKLNIVGDDTMLEQTAARLAPLFPPSRQWIVTNSEQAAAVLVALQHSAGFLRSELSHRLDLYSVPQLHFAYDDSIESGLRLSKLIDDALADDRKHSS